MAKWLLVLAAVAALAWWASRPSAAARRARAGARKNIKMSQCAKCGVYVEPGGTCKCADPSPQGQKAESAEEGERRE